MTATSHMTVFVDGLTVSAYVQAVIRRIFFMSSNPLLVTAVERKARTAYRHLLQRKRSKFELSKRFFRRSEPQRASNFSCLLLNTLGEQRMPTPGRLTLLLACTPAGANVARLHMFSRRGAQFKVQHVLAYFPTDRMS